MVLGPPLFSLPGSTHLDLCNYSSMQIILKLDPTIYLISLLECTLGISKLIYLKAIFDLLISCPNSPISEDHYPIAYAQNLEVIFDFIHCQIISICLNFLSFSLYWIECWPVRTVSVELLYTVASSRFWPKGSPFRKSEVMMRMRSESISPAPWVWCCL